jgi:hypothetical protein
MEYQGIVKNGVVVVDGATLPEGMKVIVATEDAPLTNDERNLQETTVGQRLMRFAGTMKGSDLPKDGARNHDHYLYGLPKK